MKEHARPSLEPIFVPLRTDKVKKPGVAVLEKSCCLRMREVEIRQSLLVANANNRERKSSRNRLDRPRNLVRRDSSHASDFFARKNSSEFRIPLAHFAEQLAVDSLTSGVFGIGGE